MRQLGILAVGIFLICSSASASDLIISDQTSGIETNFITNNQTQLTFTIGQLTTMVNDFGTELELPDEFAIGRGYIPGPNKTLLPSYSSLLLIPENAKLSVTVVNSSYTDIENINLSQASEEDQKWLNEDIVTANDGFYPQSLAEFEYAGKMRDVNLGRLVIRPVQYDISTKTLRVYHQVDLQVDYSGGDILPANSEVSEAFYPIYQSIALNSELVENVQQRRGAYWIIVPSNYENNISEYVNWQKAKGYYVKVISTSEISSNPNYSQVKSFIISEYNNAVMKPDYICLIGDVSTSSGVDTYSYGNPFGFGYLDSDNYYSFLLGNDYFPDVFVGRISVANTNDLAYYMNKFFQYERNPYMDDTNWYLYSTMVAGGVNDWFYSQRRTKLWVREMLRRHHYTDVDTFFSTQYDEPTTNEINASINRGMTFVNYRGYGMTEGWSSPYYTTGNIAQLSNGPRYGIMTSIVCGTGDYNDYSLCLGEAWIRYSNRGGPGFIGTSNHDSHTKWNNAIDTGIYWGLFEEGTFGLAQCQLMGKLNMYNAFPEEQYTGGRVESYFNSYNDLGDPSLMLWTGVPNDMIVSHEESVPLGSAGFIVSVTDGYDQPVRNAYVCLWKGDEIFEGMFTDANGHAGFQVDFITSGSMHLTVTKATYIPYEANVDVYNANIAVGVSNYAIDDDNNGNSEGNGDLIANPMETIEFTAHLKNFGSSETSMNVVGELISDDPHVQVTTSEVSYGNIAPGDSSLGDQTYVIQVNADAMNDLHAELNLHISDDGGNNWQNFIFLPISAVHCQVNSTTIQNDGNSNGMIDRGEVGELVLEIENVGAVDGQSITAMLSTEDSLVTVTDADGAFGDIDIDGSGTNQSNPFEISTLPLIYDGHDIEFTLTLTCASGQTQDIEFTLSVGDYDNDDPIGPDEYGYYCFDNSDTDYLFHPTFEWIPYESSWETVGIGDDEIYTKTLPFNVTYYGRTFASFSISDNGYIAMGSTWWGNFLNTNIPSPQCANGMIAPFWDDLSSTGYDNPPPFVVRYHYDEANGRLIVCWDNIRSNETFGYQDFEIIILDTAMWPTRTGDNDIIFMYNSVNGPQSASVGIVSPDRTDGIEYVFNNDYNDGATTLADELSIKFTTGSSYMVSIEGDDMESSLPGEISLHQNYPNPFNPTTNISYQLSESGDISLDIYDVLGRKVISLVDEHQAPGTYTVAWHANDSKEQPVAAGIYFYKLNTGDKEFVKKMLLVK